MLVLLEKNEVILSIIDGDSEVDVVFVDICNVVGCDVVCNVVGCDVVCNVVDCDVVCNVVGCTKPDEHPI